MTLDIFLSKYYNKNIPWESILRKEYFGKCYEDVMSKNRDAIGEHKIWVCIDETTNSGRRKMTKIIEFHNKKVLEICIFFTQNI
jgi:hypothetical protein